MLILERFLIAYTVLLMRLFDITAEQLERSRAGRSGATGLRPEGARGLHV